MNTIYRQTYYAGSAHSYAELPDDTGIEIAFAGRSNAGKSSAINALTDQKRLAKTSTTPGRTQLINHFQISEQRYIVDLPGYGYAKVPEKVKRHWHQVLERYFNERQALQGLVLLMDVRHALRDLDWQMLEWCRHAELPFHILLTKADKLKPYPADLALQAAENQLAEAGFSGSLQLFSSTKKLGIEAIHSVLDIWFELDNL